MSVPTELALKLLAPNELAKRIDHAVLKPSAGEKDLVKAVDELERLNLRCLILSPTLLREARSLTRRCLGAVVGFPNGYGALEAKIKELEDIIAYGANEVDYVANIQQLLLGNRGKFINELKAVGEICRDTGITCKVIIETPILDDPNEIYRVTRMIADTVEGISYIKTSTGFAPRPTYPEDVLAIRRALMDAGSGMGVKAAGGIRTALQALLMINLGADIIGTSSPAKILSGLSELVALLTKQTFGDE